MGFTQEDAGILSAGKLTPAAKSRVIGAAKDELVNGSKSGGFFPCGPTLSPVPGADRIALEDEKAFPDFHANVLGSYEKIVNVLNVKGQFMFAPVAFDPIALALALEPPQVPDLKFPDEFLTYAIAFPALLPKLGITSPDDIASFTAKVPTLVVPTPPNLQLPSLDIDPIKFDALLRFNAWPAKLPGLFAEVIVQIPSLLTDVLSFKFDSICETVLNAELLGSFDPRSTVQIAIAKNVVHAIAESFLIAVIGASLGSSPNGIVGGLGRTFGYRR